MYSQKETNVVFWDATIAVLFTARKECNVLITICLFYLIGECGTLGTQIVIYIIRLRSFKI